MEKCKAELTVTSSEIRSGNLIYVVAIKEDQIIGFYSLEQIMPFQFELDALYVDPCAIGQGIGTKLIRHAIHSAKIRGGNKLLIQSDPNAEAFYLAMGGKHVGTRESGSIPGRHLPMISIPLAP